MDQKGRKLIEKLKKSGQWNVALERSVLAASTLDEIDAIKMAMTSATSTTSKQTLANRARDTGLESLALKIVDGKADLKAYGNCVSETPSIVQSTPRLSYSCVTLLSLFVRVFSSG